MKVHCKNGLSNSIVMQKGCTNGIIKSKLKENLNYDRNKHVGYKSGNSVTGIIAEPIGLRGVWGKTTKPLPAPQCNAPHIAICYQSRPMHTSSNPKYFSCKKKTPYQDLCVTRNSRFSPVALTKSHTDLSKTKLCKVLESDAVERS